MATAVRANASAVITFNLDDFPESSVQPYRIDLIHPDQFLLDAYDLAPDLVFDELGRQADANKTSPKTIPEIAKALTRAGVPAFAEKIGNRQIESELAKQSEALPGKEQ